MAKLTPLTIPFSERIVLPLSPTTDSLAASSYGDARARGRLALSLVEAGYLHARGTLIITDARGTALTEEGFERRATKIDKQFWLRFAVYSDLRTRGYIVKTALKYGADFRVYERGVKPGQDHSKWIVTPVHERGTFGWHEFVAKNRVAHATRKRLLLAIVDDEEDVLYYEAAWKRP
jgi:tRNA-intron endonuclease